MQLGSRNNSQLQAVSVVLPTSPNLVVQPVAHSVQSLLPLAVL